MTSFVDADLGGEVAVVVTRKSWLSSLFDMAFGLNSWEVRHLAAELPGGRRCRLAILGSDYEESYARDRVQRSVAAGGAAALAAEFGSDELSVQLDRRDG